MKSVLITFDQAYYERIMAGSKPTTHSVLLTITIRKESISEPCEC